MVDKIPSEAWQTDQMGRAGVARFLTRHLDSSEKIRVLNINAPWGAGKSFFLENWMAEQKEIRACIYFNAWENDFTGDPFISLVSVIRDELRSIIGPALEVEGVIKNFTSKAAKAVVAATPALAKGAVKKFTGVDFAVIKDVFDEDSLGDAAEKVVEKLISSNRESINIVDDFKKVFQDLIQLASSTIAAGAAEKPVYIFIDELDRCRPTFSIELLERLKHLFTADNCKFIIATDTAQLIEAIKAVYGSGFDSGKYLKRFFDAEFALNNSDISAWVKINFTLSESPSTVEFGHLTDNPTDTAAFLSNASKPVSADIDTILSGSHGLDLDQIIFLALAQTFGSQLRELEKIVMKIHALHGNCASPNFHLFWAAYLIFLKEEAPQLYSLALYGDTQEALSALESRYKAKKLSFYSINFPVHKIFSYYLNIFRMGEEEAKKHLRTLNNDAISYKTAANHGFFKYYDALAMYPRLVELSHSLQ